MSITFEEVKRILSYDAHTGKFTWRLMLSSRGLEGSTAGYVMRNGYIMIGFSRQRFLAHRLAWFFENGEWPSADIDHINCIRTDNRLANLRVCDAAQNCANRGATSRNRSGFKGVSYAS